MIEMHPNPHSEDALAVLKTLESSPQGLSQQQVAERQKLFGKNEFPTKQPDGFVTIFLRQFLNPLIYVLLVAAVVSVILGDKTDAIFIGIVLLVNAVIGAVQEFSAERGAIALKKMVTSKSTVERSGETQEVDSSEIVPGDLLHFEPGQKIAADIRLLRSKAFEVDESLLTGESVPVEKNPQCVLHHETSLADRKNMGFTGSLVTKGRATGVAVATGRNTELGKIADSLTTALSAKPPLLIRMETLTKNIAISLVLACLAMGLVLFARGESWHHVLLFSVALAVSAIPEGLPVAITVALAIATRRMVRRNVIIRKLPAVEALGSCTFIATDKTGTLTVNQLTVREISLPGLPHFKVEGSGLDPQGAISVHTDVEPFVQFHSLQPLILCGVLCNESELRYVNDDWQGRGDAVDMAFLVLAHKAGMDPKALKKSANLIDEVPFESENQYAATLHQFGDEALISIKGAFEKLLPMCSQMHSPHGDVPIDRTLLAGKADQLAEAGLRVIALAKKLAVSELPLQNQLSDFSFLGLVGMIDPLRPEARDAVATCKRAGIEVAMVTGDHPKTAWAIAKEIGLVETLSEVVTGQQLRSVTDSNEKRKLIASSRVFARMEPQQKLELVQELLNERYFVAVTGDGANDAPALKAANVGVAMGKKGTEAAWETADLILTDDRFASVVAGVEEGRVAYSNIRKVVYLAISTGVAEILLFAFSLVFQTPLPLTPIQILWLNLVTNGIQHVALAFEPGEGNELKKPPRDPSEPIFDQLMIERVLLSAVVMGGLSFFYFHHLLNSGMDLASARNLVLLLMVLFENIMIANCRSETQSAFTMNPLRNPLLLFGTLAAQALHIASMYIPWIRETLDLEPVSLNTWLTLLVISLSVLLVMEIYKVLHRWMASPGPTKSVAV